MSGIETFFYMLSELYIKLYVEFPDYGILSYMDFCLTYGL